MNSPELTTKKPSFIKPKAAFPGISESTLTKAGVHHVGASDALSLVGYDAPGWLFPYYKMDGTPMTFDGCEPLARLRLDAPGADGAKYLSPEKAPVYGYVIPALLKPLASADYIVITEGEKKALALLEARIPAIGVSGINCAVVNGVMVPGLSHYIESYPSLRRAYFVGDSDTSTNINFTKAMIVLSRRLAKRNIELWLPRLGLLSPEKGVDDLRGALGAEKFKVRWEEMISTAEPVRPQDTEIGLFFRLLRRDSLADVGTALGKSLAEKMKESIHARAS